MKAGLTIIFAFLFGFCCAQAPIQIKSFEDHRPLPYASVANLTKRQLHFTDENGIVSANFDINDSIFISYVGYQNLKSRIEATGSQIFFLNQSNYVLEAVKIAKCRNVIKHEYSNLASGKKFGGVGWNKNAMNAKVAIMLKLESDDFILNSFSIWLRRDNGVPRHAIQAPMIFSFFSIDDSSMLPGELISNQRVVYHPKKEGKQTIQIDSLHLRIPRSGIYVSIEYVFDDKYQYPMHYIEKGIKILGTGYGGHIDGVLAKGNFTLAFYHYARDRWSFPLHRDESWLSEVHGTIKFSAELTSCKDENE